ncbi:MAG TPA: hypothetical protein VK078_08900 [Pseudogracilibacillus sp.]|nr:hypothetical protein [Pseudogracilibacillus sp.]
MNDHLQFFIRHQQQFLQDKLVLVFKSDAARDYIKNALPNCVFEELTKEQAQHAVRIGIKGQVIPYGYTMKLTTSEMKQLDVADWDKTAQLLAENNERMYLAAKEKGGAEE